MKSLHSSRIFSLLGFVTLVLNGLLAQTKVTYLPAYTDATLATKSISTALPVGSTAGAADVSGTGGASYTIPLVVPMGTNGVVPQLALSYNSQGGDGPVGMGWQIAGSSVITRTGQNPYFDGRARGMDLSLNDRYALDGMRLLTKSGSYGGDGTTYATEAESFGTITSKGVSGNGPTWFEVVSKDGTIMEYGNTADSRWPESSTTKMMWKLSKIRYRDGNYITFNYSHNGEDWILKEVKYTGNSITGLAPYNKVQFDYLDRTDMNRRYEMDYPLRNKYLLTQITVTVDGGVSFKKYNFNYASTSGHSMLRELTEVGADNSSLNSTIFQYGDVPTAFQTSSSGIVAGSSVDLISGDFDADGYSDLLAASYFYDDGQQSRKFHTDFKIYKRTASSSTMTLAATQVLASNSVLRNTSTHKQFYVSDFNGDGADDVVITRMTYGASYHTLLGVDIYTSNGLGTAFSKTTVAAPDLWNELNVKGNILFPGDYNGDGIQDLLLLAKRATTTTNDQAFIYYGGSSTSFTNVGQSGTYQISEKAWAGADKVLTGDFDGDGATDLFVVAGGKTEIYRLNGSSFEVFFSGTYPHKDFDYFLAEFNGDGKTDFLTHTIGTTNWHKLLFTGTRFVATPVSFNHTPRYTNAYSDDKMTIADVNGDGKTDIVHGWAYFEGGVASTSRIDVYTSAHDGFKYAQYSFKRPLGFSPPQVFDFNGDGRAEIIDRSNYQSPFDIFQFNKEGKELQLKKVKNGVGHVTEWVYKCMNEAGSFYTRGALSTAEIHNVQLPIYLTYELRRDNGIGSTSNMRYIYEEAKIHRKGKGFLGIRKITAEDMSMGMRTVQELSFNTTYNTAAPYRSTTYLVSNSLLLQQVTQTMELVSMGTKRYFLRTNSISHNHALEGYTSTDTYSYDTYGNVTQHTSANGIENTVTATVYAALGSAGTPVPARPTSVSVTNTRTGQSSYTVTTTYGYNSLGQLTSQVDFLGKPKSVSTTYGYDNLGYRKTTTIGPVGLIARTSTTVYDSKGRYPVTVTDPIGLITTYQYDYRWGSPTKVTTPDGLATTSIYDAYGRRTSSTLPDGYTIGESYGWAVSSTDRTVSYYLRQDPGQADVKVWYDVLGRDKKRQTEGFGGAWATEIWTYDTKGNQATSTLPYKSGETVLTTTTTYDGYNRPKSVSNSIGTTSYGYAYSSGSLTTTTTNPAAQVSSTVTDLRAGRLTSATDYGGILSYTYNSQGNLVQVKLGSTVVTTNVYDEQGRQKSMTDPNAGTTQYVYDALGQLSSQTNANGQVTTNVYDKLSRPLTRTGAEGKTTYEYFPASQGASTGKLKKITGFTTGNLEEYTYNAKGHTATKKVTIDGVAHTTSYGYDTYGRVNLTTYPSGLAVQNVYDGSGQLTNLKQSTGTVLFTNLGMNGLGQYTSYSLGNGKSSTNSYYFGTPTRFTTSGLQDLRFTWNYQSGNLTARNDALKVKSETFTYDNLNRLEDITPSGQAVHATTYTSNGNIESFGNYLNYYGYDAARVNAMISASNRSSEISSTVQNITYTPYYQPDNISEGGYTMAITYGPDYERIKSVLKQGSSTKETRYYFDGFEKQAIGSTTKYIQYLGAGDGVKIIAVSQGTTHTFHYVYTDYLGSILTVTNAAGAVIAEQNFDAWGRKRNPNTWSTGSLSTNPDWLIRGYTAHEDLAKFGLVNMNGRLYDPGVGRMLSVDNYVQSPTSSQSYNRYSYVLNNPLRYTDPTGEFWHLIIGAAIGGTLNWLANGAQFNTKGLGYFAVGAVAGALSAGIGAGVNTAMAGGSFSAGFAGTTSVASTGLLAGAASGASAGFAGGYVTGSGNAAIGGSNYGQSIMAGLRSGLTGSLIGGLTGGIKGGVDAKSKGVNPWNGKLTADVLVSGHGGEADQVINNVTGKYVGQFEGVNVFETKTMGQGGRSAGVTLPGLGIFVGDGAYSQGLNLQLLRHEFGHILQSRMFGVHNFYSKIAPLSLASATADHINGTSNHGYFWTETHANYLAVQYFGSNAFGGSSNWPISPLTAGQLAWLRLPPFPF